MKVLTLDQIKKHLDINALIGEIENAFINLFFGKMSIPPVGLLCTAKGTTHIKHGYRYILILSFTKKLREE